MLSKMKLGGSWRCRKGQELATTSLDRDREFPGSDRVQEIPRQDIAGFGSRQRISGRDRVLSGSVLRHKFLCRDIVLRL